MEKHTGEGFFITVFLHLKLSLGGKLSPSITRVAQGPPFLSHLWLCSRFQCWVSELGCQWQHSGAQGEWGLWGGKGRKGVAQHPWGAGAAGRVGEGCWKRCVMFKHHSYLVKEMLTPIPQHCKYCSSRTAISTALCWARVGGSTAKSPTAGMCFVVQRAELGNHSSRRNNRAVSWRNDFLSVSLRCRPVSQHPEIHSLLRKSSPCSTRGWYSALTPELRPRSSRGSPAPPFPWHQHPQSSLPAQQRTITSLKIKMCQAQAHFETFHVGYPCGPLACRTSIIAKTRDGLWKPECSPGCFPEVCAIHPSQKPKKVWNYLWVLQQNPIQSQTPRSAALQSHWGKHHSQTNTASRSQHGRIRLLESDWNLPADCGCQNTFSLCCSMSLHYDISERIKAEPAQLWAVTHLFSTKKRVPPITTSHSILYLLWKPLMWVMIWPQHSAIFYKLPD